MRENVGSGSDPRTEVTDAEDGGSQPAYAAQTSALKSNHKTKTSAHK